MAFVFLISILQLKEIAPKNERLHSSRTTLENDKKLAQNKFRSVLDKYKPPEIELIRKIEDYYALNTTIHIEIEYSDIDPKENVYLFEKGNPHYIHQFYSEKNHRSETYTYKYTTSSRGTYCFVFYAEDEHGLRSDDLPVNIIVKGSKPKITITKYPTPNYYYPGDTVIFTAQILDNEPNENVIVSKQFEKENKVKIDEFHSSNEPKTIDVTVNIPSNEGPGTKTIYIYASDSEFEIYEKLEITILKNPDQTPSSTPKTIPLQTPSSTPETISSQTPSSTPETIPSQTTIYITVITPSSTANYDTDTSSTDNAQGGDTTNNKIRVGAITVIVLVTIIAIVIVVAVIIFRLRNNEPDSEPGIEMVQESIVGVPANGITVESSLFASIIDETETDVYRNQSDETETTDVFEADD